jgi:hypothetical protein
VRSGDIGDEAARSADDADMPLDLAAVRADDDLIEALSAGLVPPPSGPRDPSDVEGELVALLAGWVADVRPESLLHPPGSKPAAVRLIGSSTAEAADEHEPLAAVGSTAPVRSLLEYEDADPFATTSGRRSGARAYLLRAAAALAAIALIGSGVVVRSYDAHPGDSLWLVAQVVFPAKSRSVEAATVVSTALNTARVALESGRIEEARAAFQTVEDKLAAVDDADGRVELAHQRDYLTAQLSNPAHDPAQPRVAPPAGPQLATGQAGATIPSGPSATPGATAILTPTSSPSVLAAAPPSGGSGASSSGSAPAVSGSSSPAVVAAPPVDPGVSAPPAASDPAPSDAAAGSSSGSAPAAASPPPADPATDPPAPSPSPEPPAPTSAPEEPATTVPSTPDPPADNGGSGGDGSSESSQSVAPDDTTGGGSSNESSDGSGSASEQSSEQSSENSADDSNGGQESSKSTEETAAASAEISLDGLAGSTLGAVTGVVASTAGSS